MLMSDDVMEVLCNRNIDVCCLIETWHDTNSVTIGRLRTSSFQVVDRLHLRISDNTSTNHGGVPVLASASVRVRRIVIEDRSAFELVCVRISPAQCSYVVVVLYRPGSTPVRQEFFNDLSAVLAVIATYRDPVLLTGDYNVRLDRSVDAHDCSRTVTVLHYF